MGACIEVLQWLNEIQYNYKVAAKYQWVMGSKSFEWIFYPLVFKSCMEPFAWISPRTSTPNLEFFKKIKVLQNVACLL